MPYAGSPRAGSPHPSRVLPGVLEDSADDDRAPVPPGPGPLRPDALPAVRPPWPAAARDLAGPVAQLRRRHSRSRPSGRSCAARSTSASPTSTWPTTTARPTAARRRNFGRIFAQDFAPYRDELVISTKAGYDMWPGPYGERRLAQVPAGLASTSRWPGWASTTSTSSTRHRFDPRHAARGDHGRAGHRGALRPGAVRRHLVLLAGADPRGGRDPARPRHAAADPPAVVLDAQPLDRGRESLLDVLGDEGVGCIAFSPLAQGMLTDRYLDGIPADSRAAQGKSLDPALLDRAERSPTSGR